MADLHAQRDLKALLRFYGFALRHWKWILLSFAGMLVYAAVSFNVLLLIEPMSNTIQQRQASATSGSAPDLVPAAEPDAEPGRPLEEDVDSVEGAKKRLEVWLMELGPVKRFFRWMAPGDDPSAAMKRLALLIALVLGPLFVLSSVAKDYAAGRATWAITTDIRVAVFSRLTELSLSYFSKQRSGELISRLTNDINGANKALKVIFGKIMLQPIMFVAFLTGAFLTSWQLSLLALATMPVLVIITSYLGRKIRRYGRKTLEKLADVTDAISQMLSGIRVVKAFNMEEAEREEFRERNRQQLVKACKLVKNRALASALPELVMLVPIVLMLLVADRLVGEGLLTFSGMIQWTGAAVLMAGPVRRTVRGYNDLQESLAGVTRIFALLDAEPDITDSPDAVDVSDLRQAVEFRDVWFAYDTEPVLRGIDLTVPRGKVYAVVGETGAGKSTLLDLVPRFYETTHGSVLIDGVDVRRIKRASLMRLVAIVGQSPFLFNRSIAENIRYGKPGATDREVVAAARSANIHKFIEGLPDGYNTVVGEAGDRLSGGQRQCVTIARAILKQAPILILDEATSNLDAESELLVQQALTGLLKDRTTFVIAHRLSTVRHADRIVVLRDGAIVEEGTHDELMRLGGEYERLCRLQFGAGAS